ncbi:hypothetical protein [Herbaspirillum sp. C7C8]|uniref:hypothetical protein n=1 Tax=Herbaspirillum sp. C7C8 TaxID=2736665 RepID=UPI001F523D54|nr:hypothetical protein [Herbaspirillum sp. C7C8]MCI1007577.1 hypothetical protein [Herbaspirillum sp. C7C8]
MNEISKYTASPSTIAAPDAPPASSAVKVAYASAVGAPAETVATVSTLAQQISDAATRAAARDAKIGSSGLAAAATSIVDKLTGLSYQANKAANDAEVPNTDDPTLLARAKQATDSINGKGANPFSGLSRDQLALIAYDEGGSFTVNERKAALDEAKNQESQWRQQTFAKAMSTYKGGEGANSRETGKQLLDHLKSLSPIEQAQYPQSYAVQLQVMAESGATYSAASPLDALKFLSQLNKWATTPEVDGLPSVATADVGVLPKPDLAKFEADASLPRNELMAKYEKAVRSLPSMRSADLPISNDPDRLAQAMKATDYAWGNGPSPFTSLTRNEVVAIYYDDSGTYTRDERMAAVKQLNEIDRNLWDGLTTRAANTGDWREVNEMGLKNYDDLLPIEKMRYPANYKMQLQQLLAYDNAKAGGALSKEQKKTLLEMMDALNRHQPETAPESKGKSDDARPWNDSWSAKLADLVRHAISRGAASSVDMAGTDS